MTKQRRLLVTVAEAAEILSLSERRVYELVAAGEFTRRYTGSRNYRLDFAELEAWTEALPQEPDGA